MLLLSSHVHPLPFSPDYTFFTVSAPAAIRLQQNNKNLFFRVAAAALSCYLSLLRFLLLYKKFSVHLYDFRLSWFFLVLHNKWVFLKFCSYFYYKRERIMLMSSWAAEVNRFFNECSNCFQCTYLITFSQMPKKKNYTCSSYVLRVCVCAWVIAHRNKTYAPDITLKTVLLRVTFKHSIYMFCRFNSKI